MHVACRRRSHSACQGRQPLGVAICAFIFTWIMLWLINKVTVVRVTEQQEDDLDRQLHGEAAYVY